MRPLCAALALAAASCNAAAQAGEPHSPASSAGPMSGWMLPLSSRLQLHGEPMSMGGIAGDTIEVGVSYGSTLRSDRVSFLMDWFVQGGVRLTGGLTFNRMRVDLRPTGRTGAIMLGDSASAAGHGDRVDIAARWPYAVPYLGVGYGLPLGTGSGLLFDVGASFGKVSLSEPRNGPLLGSGSQTELDMQLAQLHESLGPYRFVPRVSLGVKLRF